ncbi:hypothetical protein LCGC14_1321780 [marine sediment metagenome]|uniref:TonB-dependent receptor-like beta-barrel domain-containing protein n=1 Tax=marine sediment metagenome TaxID=412755 RepID=A0A0F9NLN4_9ZZZZ
MGKLIDREATFRTTSIVDGGVGQTSSGLPQLTLSLRADEIYDFDEKVWVLWDDVEEREITAYLVLIGKKDNEIFHCKSIEKALGWDGASLASLAAIEFQSVGIQFTIKENTYEVSLEGYYKTINDILDFKTGAQLLLNENIETEVLQGLGQSYGLEFLIRKNEGKLNGWLAYTYSRSFTKLDSEFSEERVNGGDYFPSNYDKPHDLSVVANYKFTRRFSVSANFAYQTGRPVTYPLGSYRYQDADYVLYSDRNQFRIPDYYRLDLSLNIEGVATEEGNICFAVYNNGDKQIRS